MYRGDRCALRRTISCLPKLLKEWSRSLAHGLVLTPLASPTHSFFCAALQTSTPMSNRQKLIAHARSRFRDQSRNSWNSSDARSIGQSPLRQRQASGRSVMSDEGSTSSPNRAMGTAVDNLSPSLSIVKAVSSWTMRGRQRASARSLLDSASVESDSAPAGSPLSQGSGSPRHRYYSPVGVGMRVVKQHSFGGLDPTPEGAEN